MQGNVKWAGRGAGRTKNRTGIDRVRRGTKVHRCGAWTPSFDLRRDKSKLYSAPLLFDAGRNWAFRPTAQEFTPTLL